MENIGMAVDLIEAEILIQKDELRQALTKLQSIKLDADYEYCKMLGLLHWKLGEFDKALIPLLKVRPVKRKLLLLLLLISF